MLRPFINALIAAAIMPTPFHAQSASRKHTDLPPIQAVPACVDLPGGAPPAVKTPSFVDEPIQQLQRMVPGLRGIRIDADGKAAEAQDKSAFILDKTGTAIASLLRRTPNLIATEEVRRPMASRPIDGVGLDGALTDLEPDTLASALDLGAAGDRGARYEAYFFTYRIVRSRNASGANSFDEFRTDAHDRQLDCSTQKVCEPFSMGFATTWMFFLPGNLRESRFRYLGQQSIGNRKTYVLAFARNPGDPGLDAVIEYGTGRCSTPLQGIAWIDQSTFQLVRVETDLLTPLPGIQLNQLRSIVHYGPVKIRGLNRTLWLPDEAGTTWQTASGFGDELHLYSHYELFKSTARILPYGENPPR